MVLVFRCYVDILGSVDSTEGFIFHVYYDGVCFLFDLPDLTKGIENVWVMIVYDMLRVIESKYFKSKKKSLSLLLSVGLSLYLPRGALGLGNCRGGCHCVFQYQKPNNRC